MISATPHSHGPLSLQKNNSGTQTPAVTTTRHDTYTTIDIHKPGTLFVSGLIKVRGGEGRGGEWSADLLYSKVRGGEWSADLLYSKVRGGSGVLTCCTAR